MPIDAPHGNWGGAPRSAPAQRPSRRCDFCGVNGWHGPRMCAGNGVHICERCVTECATLLRFDGLEVGTGNALSPRAIDEALGQDVIGQHRARRALAVAAFTHALRTRHRSTATEREAERDISLTTSNILLVGPTGTGKTLLVKSLATLLDVPCVVVDVTSMTQAGYAGDNVESIARRLLEAADGNVEVASRGIVYLDEIDKLARRPGRGGSGPDVGGEGVQQSLLKMVEGHVVDVPARQDGAVGPKLDTSNVLFVAGGAFSEAHERLHRRDDFGFGPGNPSGGAGRRVGAGILREDLIEFGMLSEFVGRFPVVVPLEPLTRAELVRVLHEPRNSMIREFETVFRLAGRSLRFEPAALVAVAEWAEQRSVGARGLRGALEAVLAEEMFSFEATTHESSAVLPETVVDVAMVLRALPGLSGTREKTINLFATP